MRAAVVHVALTGIIVIGLSAVHVTASGNQADTGAAATSQAGLTEQTATGEEEKHRIDHRLQTSQSFTESLTALTGQAVSPLFATCALGCYQYWKTPSELRAQLPWYDSPYLWGIGFGVLILLLFNETITNMFPAVTQPLKIIDVIENKVSGWVLAAPAAISMVAVSLSQPAGVASAALWNLVEPSANADSGTMLMTLPPVFRILGWVVAVLISLIAFGVVWLCSHALHIIVLLLPIPLLGLATKALRIGYLVVLTLATWISPIAGLVISLLTIAIAILISGWSLRLTTLGTVFAADLLTLKARRVTIDDKKESAILAFSGKNLKKSKPRTLGRVSLSNGRMVFSYRPLLLFPPRRIQILQEHVVVSTGLINPYIEHLSEPTGERKCLFVLPPRYRGHEEELVRCLNLDGVAETQIIKGIRSVLRRMRPQKLHRGVSG